MHQRIKPRKIATPYSFYETAGVVYRNLFGLDHSNHGLIMPFFPNEHIINPIIRVENRLAFVGDIMSVGNHRINIDESVKQFLSGCEYLVANLEATVTNQRGRKGVLYGAFQWQNDHVADVMAQLFPPAMTYLSVANNHAGDFEDQYYLQSCALLEKLGFNLFGQAERPYVDINERVRLHSGTMWSNQICDRVHWLGSDNKGMIGPHLNILFPHWGYELEKYPRPEIVSLAKNLCLKYDAILGHHPHTVQPVTIERSDGRNILVAYSLGDFCSNIPLKSYQFGIIIKVEIGPTLPGEYAVGNINWRFIECRRKTGDALIIRIADSIPYFKKAVL
jgi:hypothetical protein